MAKFCLTFLILLLFHFSTDLSQADDDFLFHGFTNTSSKIGLSGSAEIENNGILRLTREASKIIGHAFYGSPFQFKNSTDGKVSSFSTAFAFSIVPQSDKFGGHGFAFAIYTSRDITQALPSQYLGLMNSSTVGNLSNHVFAVEFDTVQDFEFGDINDNHVGIDINSLISEASADASSVTVDEEALALKNADGIQAWIDYDSDEQKLNVSLSASSSKPSLPILSYDVDLSPVLLENMYVGFSASTGLLASSHYISGWSFKMNGQTKSLDLSALPTVPKQKSNKLPSALGISFSLAAVLILAIGISLYIMKRVKNRDVIEPWELDVGPHRYSYSELKKATRDFRDEELLGFGGFGKVYKGTLPNSHIQVAVKRIDSRSKQGLREFLSEIKTIGRLRHRNLVSLQGWCRQRNDLLLVYDFMPNGSLDQYIFDEPKIVLSWEQRYKILKGVASALLYLHEEWEQTVIHRDIKAGNVLLDCEMNGRLGDFGLAKLYEHGSNPSTTKVVGTLGYLAPELTRTGKATTSSDMFAFGALLLEVVCGRKPIEIKAMPEELILVEWVWDKWKKGCAFDAVDQRLKGEFDELEVVVAIKLGLMCSNTSPSKRPRIREVMRYLEGEMALPEGPAMAPPLQEEYDGMKHFGSNTRTPEDINCKQ